MPALAEVHRAALQYVTGKLDSISFAEWFVEASRDGFSDQAALSLANKIEGLIAEARHAGWAESELREELAGAIQHREPSRIPA